MRTDSLLSCHERAVRATLTVVARISPSDLSRPTPCSAWDLAQLLAHMTGQHQVFAAAAAGVERRGDPTQSYPDAAEAVIAAFAAPGVPDRDFLLPEITTRPVPGRLAIGFHLVDYVVHGWDVARTLGLPYELPADVLATALPIAAAVPGGPSRTAPGAAFAPSLPDPGGDGLDRILTLLGRDPRRNVVPGR